MSSNDNLLPQLETLRFRHYNDADTGRMVATIGTCLTDDPSKITVAAAICSPKDTPSRKKAKMIIAGRYEVGKYRIMDREELKEAIRTRTILDYFDTGNHEYTLRPPRERKA